MKPDPRVVPRTSPSQERLNLYKIVKKRVTKTRLNSPAITFIGICLSNSVVFRRGVPQFVTTARSVGSFIRPLQFSLALLHFACVYSSFSSCSNLRTEESPQREPQRWCPYHAKCLRHCFAFAFASSSMALWSTQTQHPRSLAQSLLFVSSAPFPNSYPLMTSRQSGFPNRRRNLFVRFVLFLKSYRQMSRRDPWPGLAGCPHASASVAETPVSVLRLWIARRRFFSQIAQQRSRWWRLLQQTHVCTSRLKGKGTLVNQKWARSRAGDAAAAHAPKKTAVRWLRPKTQA